MPEVGMMPFGEMGMPGGQHIFHHHIMHFPNQFNPFGFGFNPFGFGFNPIGFGFNPIGFGFNPIGFGFNPMGFGFNPMGFGFNPFMSRGQQQPMFGGSPFMGQ